MEVITSNILHLGVIASEDEFQRGVRRGEKERGNSNLHRIYKSPESNLGIFVHILFYSLKTITHEMHAHTHKQPHTNNSHYSIAQMYLCL